MGAPWIQEHLIIMTLEHRQRPHLIENASETGEIAESVRKKVMNELARSFPARVF